MDKQVLYAEDEYTNRKLMEIKLSNKNISCDIASDGIQATELIKKNEYKLIILDQYMPGLNGDQIALTLRKTNPDIPLIAITSDDCEIQNLLDSGFNEVFIKPIRGEAYLNIIRKYISNEA